MTLRASNCERRGTGVAWKPSPQAEGHGTRQRHLLWRPRLRDAALAAPVVDARPERAGACLAAGQTREIEGALRLRFRCGRRRGGQVGQARVRGGARRPPERRHARCQSAQCGLQRRGRHLLALRFRFRRRRSGEVGQARVRFRVLRMPERRHGRHSRRWRRTATARWHLGHVSGQVNCRGVLRPCFLVLHYRESSRAASVHFCRDVAHRSFARAAAQGVRLPIWWVCGSAPHKRRRATCASHGLRQSQRGAKPSCTQPCVVLRFAEAATAGRARAAAECQRYTRSSASAASSALQSTLKHALPWHSNARFRLALQQVLQQRFTQ